ncbi:hypothetical protein CYMTET_38866 [Cymbomonas tetramitiformis]|uniref:Uncharacterized protein n=1 Tax=Cymbomonas tetramitiformis TaxID=36881 RepID=A0AAE0F4H9_9CHLO|nr:hypothetical protein CYMTET_38864 [Cymbomonas tetramitiformis]KAK3251813.1 hypothetical protein CYMTET_38866 [Cymbomonas tetramitiformis]
MGRGFVDTAYLLAACPISTGTQFRTRLRRKIQKLTTGTSVFSTAQLANAHSVSIRKNLLDNRWQPEPIHGVKHSSTDQMRLERSRVQLHDETLRHMRSSEARAALLGRRLGGGARRFDSNSLTGTVPTELGELTGMTYISAGRGWQRGAGRLREGANASSMSGLVPALGVGWCRHDMASGAELQGRGQQDAPTFEEAWPNSMLQQVTEWSRGGRNTPTLPGSRSLSTE